MTFRSMLEAKTFTVHVLDNKVENNHQMFTEYIGYQTTVSASNSKKAIGKAKAILAKQILSKGKNVYKQYNEAELRDLLKRFLEFTVK